MPRFVLAALAVAALFLIPAVAQGDSGIHVRGAVAAKSRATHLVAIRSPRQLAAVRVPGSLTPIHVGEKVELRGSTLRASGAAGQVLARDVTVVRTRALNTTAVNQSGDDEVEITGKLTSLAPVTVQSGGRTVVCTAHAGTSLAGLMVGDVVEMTCDLQAGVWVVRKLEREDGAANAPNLDDEDDNSSVSGSGDDDSSEDHSGPSQGDGDDDHGHSGSGGGDDD